MFKKLKYGVITLFGGLLTLIGAVFIVLPGPAFLFLPVGLAILSLEHKWAKVWLKYTQRFMRKGAIKMDQFTHNIKLMFRAN